MISVLRWLEKLKNKEINIKWDKFMKLSNTTIGILVAAVIGAGILLYVTNKYDVTITEKAPVFTAQDMLSNYQDWADDYKPADYEGKALDAENTMVIGLSVGGPIIIEMFDDIAPNHVARFKELARSNFYDGITFHRVIEGFMAQGGDPTGTGAGGSELPDLVQEFSDIPHTKGILSTARTQDPDTANSQFFIMFDTIPSLDRQYTVWGKVISGIEFVDAIQRGSGNNGAVDPEVRTSITFMKVAADIAD